MKQNNVLETWQNKLPNYATTTYSMGEGGNFYIILFEFIPNEYILRYLFIILFSWWRLSHLYQKKRAADSGRRQLIHDPPTFQADLPLSLSLSIVMDVWMIFSAFLFR